MILFFFILISGFLAVVLYLKWQFAQQQEQFSKRMQTLQQTIVELNRKAMQQGRQLQLNEELEQMLRARRPELGHMVFSLNFNLFELLSKNQLLGAEK